MTEMPPSGAVVEAPPAANGRSTSARGAHADADTPTRPAAETELKASLEDSPSGVTRIERRVEQLRAEMRAGEERLRELDAERARIRDTMLRIDGAIMALSELASRPESDSPSEQPRDD